LHYGKLNQSKERAGCIYTLNFLDRILISVLSRPIIEEFSLSNFEFGILSGIGFALFYTALGIPIARLSEHMSRIKIIGFCLILWSIATVLCGFAAGFVTLLFARLAVGVGEAGCTPPANSVISDYYRPSDRPVALGIYAMGIPLGSVLAQLGGGFVVKAFTWREAFIYIGAPGVLIGVILLLTIKEPPRGYSDPVDTVPVKNVSFKAAIDELMGKPSFWWMTAGMSMGTFGGYGLIMFKSLFLQYTFDLSPGDAAIYYMAPIAFAGAVGAPLAGYLIKKYSKTNELASLWVPAFAFFISSPLLITAFLSHNLTVSFIAFICAGLFQYFYIAASFNIVQSITSQRVRATAIAFMLFLINLIGYGAGPPFVGAVADILTSTRLESFGVSEVLNFGCNPKDVTLGAELQNRCLEAKAYGMKWAAVTASTIFSLAGVLYIIAGRHYRKDVALLRGQLFT